MTGFPNPNLFNMGNPTGSVGEKAQNAYEAAQHANLVSQNFGIPLQGEHPGMWANILPAAIQIEEHKKMNEVAQQYQQQYVKNFQDRYGFKEGDLEGLKKEFQQITDHITDLIPDGDLRTMYKKYVQSYPHMYMSMIPPEALQSKLAVKCVRENALLREEVSKMSKCVTTLVQGLSKLQMAAGVPPIVSLMFESMPDPLTAITDPMYSAYNDAIETYHALAGTKKYDNTITVSVDDVNGVTQQKPASSVLLSDPLKALKTFEDAAKAATDSNNNPIGYLEMESGEIVTPEKIKALKTVVENMKTSSGCQTFGNEWNHTGPEPAMNPAMCLGEKDVMQPGNPRNALGRTAVYKAQRTQDGGAQWVMKGQVPNAMGDGQHQNVFNHAQIAQSARYHQQPAGDWAHYAQAPAPRRTSKKKSSKASGKKKGRKASK